MEVVRQADERPAQRCFEIEGVHEMRRPVRRHRVGEGAFGRAEAEHAAHHHEGFGSEHCLLAEAFDVGDGVFGHGHAI